GLRGRATSISTSPGAATMSVPATRVEEGFVLMGHATRFPGKFEAVWRGRRVIDRAVESVLAAGLRATIVSTRPFASSPAPVRLDPFDRGPLGGLRAILKDREGGPFFLTGADMPQVQLSAVHRLIELAAPGVSVVPRWSDGTLEVLHAIYDPPVEEVVRFWEGRRSLRDLVRELGAGGRARFVAAEEFDPATFADIDTVEDLERLRSGPAP
ncbi:MAG: molybdenum cofactor guanylyltransferase, partial [Thermoplasmata archaeon]